MGDLLNFLFKYYYIGLHDGYSCYVNLYFHILSQINHHYTNVFYHSIFCPLLFVFFFFSRKSSNYDSFEARLQYNLTQTIIYTIEYCLTFDEMNKVIVKKTMKNERNITNTPRNKFNLYKYCFDCF